MTHIPLPRDFNRSSRRGRASTMKTLVLNFVRAKSVGSFVGGAQYSCSTADLVLIVAGIVLL